MKKKLLKKLDKSTRLLLLQEQQKNYDHLAFLEWLVNALEGGYTTETILEEINLYLDKYKKKEVV